MSLPFDVIVIGLGGMGSAAAHHLARRGKRVLGLEQFTSPHDKGSSHGRSRVIRQAYYEDPVYVPLLLRAYELWRDLERSSSKQLLTITGGLMLGTERSAVVSGSLKSARQHSLSHELLDANEIRKRFPQFHPEPNTVAVFERNAGFVRPEEAVRAHLDQAARHGATLNFEEEVLDWDADDKSVRVKTRRDNYEAGQMVVCAGAWTTRLLADLSLPLEVERQVQFWFEPKQGIEAFAPDRFPIWIWQTSDGTQPYGLPACDGPDGGVKVALHHGGNNTKCTPKTIDREITNEEVAEVRQHIAARIPGLNGRRLRAVTCMYTNAPDQHFIIGRHLKLPSVLVISACSGHGFKFCPVIGEIVGQIIESGHTRHPINLFGLRRLDTM